MAQSNFFPSRPNLTPQIYAYSDPNYEGQLKVGYTAHDVRRKMDDCLNYLSCNQKKFCSLPIILNFETIVSRSTLCGAYSSFSES